MQQSVERHQKATTQRKYGTVDSFFVLQMIASCTTRWDLLRKKYRRRFAICLTTTDILICSFNNNLLEKCTNGKALNKVTTAHFLATLIQEHLVDFECFLRYIFNFMASKQPNR